MIPVYCKNRPQIRGNECIYIDEIDFINGETSLNDNPLPFVMEKSHSVDIDALSDLAHARHFMNLSNNTVKKQ